MVLIPLALIVAIIFLLLRYVYSYWERKGFPYLKPSIPYGNLDSFRKKEKSFTFSVSDLYDKTKEPFIGVYLFFRPAILIRDADLVKKVLSDDFTSFYDRGVHSNKKSNPMSGNIFNLEGKDWKDMRTKLSPVFTSGKLKAMFPTLENVANLMDQYLDRVVQKDGTVVELKDLTTKYSLDIIVSTFFGCDVDSFTNDDHIFTKFRDMSFSRDFLFNLANASMFLAPKLFDWLQLYRVLRKQSQTMIDIVQTTIDNREKYDIQRKDFMQLIMQYRNTGEIKEDGDWSAKATTKGGVKAISIEDIAAQAFVFFMAGHETTAASIAFCLYELARNDEVMQKLLTDINETLEKHNGEITYDSITEMKYLDLVLMETVRKYPALPILNRQCTKAYQIPGSNFTIEKGTAVVISMMGLHRDPAYFPDPLKFDPDRFSPENKNYNENAYIPFGDGPKTCIGLRQGKLSSKFCIVKILTKYKVEGIETKEIEFDNYHLSLIPKGGLNVKLTKICK